MQGLNVVLGLQLSALFSSPHVPEETRTKRAEERGGPETGMYKKVYEPFVTSLKAGFQMFIF